MIRRSMILAIVALGSTCGLCCGGGDGSPVAAPVIWRDFIADGYGEVVAVRKYSNDSLAVVANVFEGTTQGVDCHKVNAASGLRDDTFRWTSPLRGRSHRAVDFQVGAQSKGYVFGNYWKTETENWMFCVEYSLDTGEATAFFDYRPEGYPYLAAAEVDPTTNTAYLLGRRPVWTRPPEKAPYYEYEMFVAAFDLRYLALKFFSKLPIKADAIAGLDLALFRDTLLVCTSEYPRTEGEPFNVVGLYAFSKANGAVLGFNYFQPVPGESYDVASLAADGEKGVAYLCGDSTPPHDDGDPVDSRMFLSKFDANYLTHLWTVTESIGSSHDRASEAVVSPTGFVYLFGFFTDEDDRNVGALLKFNPDGTPAPLRQGGVVPHLYQFSIPGDGCILTCGDTDLTSVFAGFSTGSYGGVRKIHDSERDDL